MNQEAIKVYVVRDELMGLYVPDTVEWHETYNSAYSSARWMIDSARDAGYVVHGSLKRDWYVTYGWKRQGDFREIVIDEHYATEDEVREYCEYEGITCWLDDDDYEHDEDEDTSDSLDTEDTGNDDYDGTGNPFRK